MKNQSIGEMGLDTRLLLQKLLSVEVGAEVTYDELAQEIGREVRPGTKGYALLQSARRAALNTEFRVFSAVPKIGLRRLDDAGIVDASSGDITKIHTTARRAVKKLACVENFNALPRDKQVRHNLHASVLGAVAHASSAKTTKKLENKVAQVGKSLPLTQTLEECKLMYSGK